MRFVINHPEMGIYLGSCMGLGFWTKLDAAGQASAVTFQTEADAEMFMASWDGGRPDGATLVPVVPDDGTYASVAACVAAGLNGWGVADEFLGAEDVGQLGPRMRG